MATRSSRQTGRQPNRGAHRQIVQVLAAGSLALLLAACGAASPSASGPARIAVPVMLATVSKGNIAASLTYNGQLTPTYLVTVVPKASGRILKLSVDVGSSVKQGQVIARIEHTELDAQLAQAKANLQAAEAKLATVQAGGRPEQVAQAQASLDATRAKLAGVQRQGRPAQVAQAQASLDAAQAKLAAARQGRPAQIGQAQANLDAAKAKLAQLMDGPTPAQVEQARLAVQQAKDNLYAQQTALDRQVAAGLASKDQRQSALDVAQTQVDQANAALKVLTDPPAADAVNQAKAAVDVATHQLRVAQHPGSAQDVARAQAAVNAAQQQLNLARAPYTAQDIGQAQAAVNGAAAAVALAQRPYTKQDAQVAAAGVAQAQAAVDLVQTQLADAAVTAPVGGIIAKKMANQGDMASPTSPLVSITSTSWEADVHVAEDSIGQVHRGEKVNMVAAAYPTQPFRGTISTIAPLVDSQTRTFTVKIVPTGSTPRLRGGMSTRIEIPTAVHDGVLLVPKAAVIQKDGRTVVFVVAGGKAYATAVRLGLSDGASTEIVAGLAADQRVVVQGQDNLNDGDPVRVQARPSTSAAGSPRPAPGS
ncbi:MAG: efflux RND transporter periplasmic adaptor subunit [Chloroflexota bacterium]